MKVIIELDDDMLKKIRDSHFEASRKIVRSFPATIANSIRNGKLILNNATNGDMIKAMLPNGKYETNGNFVHVYIQYFAIIQTMTFDLSWWNAPYKRGVKHD